MVGTICSGKLNLQSSNKFHPISKFMRRNRSIDQAVLPGYHDLLQETIDVSLPLITTYSKRESLLASLRSQWSLLLGIPYRESVVSAQSVSESKTSTASAMSELEEGEPFSLAVAPPSPVKVPFPNVRFPSSFSGSSNDRNSMADVLSVSSSSGAPKSDGKPIVMEESSEGEPFRLRDPQYEITDIGKLSNKKGTGLFLGILPSKNHIDIVSIKRYSNGDIAPTTATYSRGSGQLLNRIGECLSNFLEENNFLDDRLVASLAVYNSDRKKELLQVPDVRKHMIRFENTKNVDWRSAVVPASAALLVAGLYEKEPVDFAITVRDSVEIALKRKVQLPSGRKSRKVVLIDGNAVYTEGAVGFLKTSLEEDLASNNWPLSLVSVLGIADVAQRYLIAAIEQGGILNGFVTQSLSQSTLTLEQIINIATLNEGTLDVLESCRDALAGIGYQDATNSDCVQAQFICEAVLRRSCAIIAATIVTLAGKISNNSARCLICGPISNYPKFLHYLRSEIKILCPPSLEITVAEKIRRDICIGAGLLSANEFGVNSRYDFRHTLPPFRLQCCYNDKVCCPHGDSPRSPKSRGKRTSRLLV